ncbi:hypothetical protein V2J09_000951 [Rumex salicifolius]
MPIRCFGVDMSPNTIANAMVYFVQGVLGLSRLSVSFYFKDDLHLDPEETAIITGFASFPWLVKPLYGFISDSIPLFGYRRRSYLFLSGLLGAFSWSLMATFVDSTYSAAFYSMVVERARGESQSMSGSLQSLCWGFSAVGGIVSSYFSGSLVGTYGVRFVFGVMALLPLITSAVALLVKEQRATAPLLESNQNEKYSGFVDSSKEHVMQLRYAVKQPNVFFPTLFIFLWQATPQSDSAMFFFAYASFMPVLVLAAKLCPEGMEATFFATLMSISNGGSVLGGLIGTGLTQTFGVTKDSFSNLAVLIILCSLTSLLPLPLLGLLSRDDSDPLPEDNYDIEMKST